MQMFKSFQGTEASKVQLTSAQGQLYRSSKVSPTLFRESRTTEDTNFHLTNHPFHSKFESNGLQVYHNCKFSERIFTTPAMFKATSFFSAHWAALMKKTNLNYPAFP